MLPKLDGTEAARLVESYPKGKRVFTLSVPADGQTGVYRLSVARPGSFGSTRRPIVVEPALPVAFPITGRIFPRDEAGYPIWVPPGATWLLHCAGDVSTMQLIGEGAQVPQLLFQAKYPAEVCEAFAAAE